MTIKMLIASSARFLFKLVAYYFATLIVLALLFPGVDKYQIIFFSWICGATVALYGHRLELQRE